MPVLAMKQKKKKKKNNTMKKYQIIQLPKISDPRGNLSFFESGKLIPFDIQRVHWIYDVPGGEERGGVAYEHTEEFVVAMSGSFDVVLNDGKGKQIISLNRSYNGVYIPRGVWRELTNYSSNSVALIAASTNYDPNEGIRDYDEFVAKIKQGGFANSQLISVNKARILSIKKNFVFDCGIIELDKHHSIKKGNLSVVENGKTLPFDINRIYYLYDVPGGEDRGGHAHKGLWQLIVAASGSFTVTLNDGQVKRSFVLNRPYQGLLVAPGIWRDLTDFSSGSVCMVLASEKYDEEDYIREYQKYVDYRKKLK